MDETRYRVVLNGSLTGEFDEATTRRNLSRLFRLNQEKVRVLMSGRERVIKSDLTEAVAMTYLIRLAEAGCESYVQRSVTAMDLTLMRSAAMMSAACAFAAALAPAPLCLIDGCRFGGRST